MEPVGPVEPPTWPPTELPWPEGWQRPGAAMLAAGTAYWVAFVLPLGWLIRDGAWPLVALYWTGVAATHVFFAIALRPPRQDRVVARNGALVLPVSRRLVLAGFAALAAGGVVATTAMAVILPAWWAAAFALVMVGALGWYLWLRAWADELQLTAYGVTWRQRRRRTIEWERLVAVEAFDHQQEARGVTVHTPQIVLRPAYGATVRVLAQALDADPATTYWTVRYYAEHPEARDELADGRAADRVRRRDLLRPP